MSPKPQVIPHHSPNAPHCLDFPIHLFFRASVMKSPPSLPPHHTPTSAEAPFPRLLKYFTCGRPGRAGPRAPQMRVDGERAAEERLCTALQSFALFSIDLYLFLQSQCSSAIVEHFAQIGIWNCNGNCTVALLSLFLETPCLLVGWG